MRAGGPGERAGGHPGVRPGGAVLHAHLDRVQRREVEHDAVVHAAVTRRAMPPTPYGERRAALASVGYDPGDIARVPRTHDRGRLRHQSAVVDGARLVIARVSRDDHLAAHEAAKMPDLSWRSLYG